MACAETTCLLRTALFLSTFRHNLSVLSSGVKEVEPWTRNPIGCPETSVRNYHYSLRNDPGERSSHLLCTTFFFLWFQASAAKLLRTTLFWVITRQVVVISYRRFGTIYRSHSQVSRIPKKACSRIGKSVDGENISVEWCQPLGLLQVVGAGREADLGGSSSLCPDDMWPSQQNASQTQH